MAYFLQLVVNAAQISTLYGLLAVSYVLIHAITRRINFAFGGMAVIAGYAAINITMVGLMQAPGDIALVIVVAVLVAVAHGALTGALVHRLVLRPLQRATSLAVLVATLGVAIVLEEIARLSNDGRERWLPPLLDAPLRIGGSDAFTVQITTIKLAVLVVSVAIAIALVVFIARHPFGRIWRAVAQDLEMAELCGVDVARTLGITVVLASAAAGAAGALISISYGVASFYGGFVIGLKTLLVAVVGGLGSVGGAFLGGLLLGTFETLWSGYAPAEWRDVAAFLLLAGLLVAFPAGLGSTMRRGPEPV